MGNDAIYVNYDYADQLGITTNGSNWLWAAFGVMLLSDLIVLGWHFTIPRGQRIFHQLGLIILTTASIAYFSMASNLGSTPIATEFAHLGYPVGTLRQIWYVRYIDWTITTPALLLELCLASGLPLSDIVTLVFFDLVMIVTGLVGALVKSSYKWGFFAFGCAALIYIWWVLLFPARTSAKALGPDYHKSFILSGCVLSFLWLAYPIAWGLADGGTVIYPDSEMIFYGTLDVLAKPVFLFIHLLSISKLDMSALQLQSGKYTTSAADGTLIGREKGRESRVASGHHDSPENGNIHNAVHANPPDSTLNSVNSPAVNSAPVSTPVGTSGLSPRKGRSDVRAPAASTVSQPIGSRASEVAGDTRASELGSVRH